MTVPRPRAAGHREIDHTADLGFEVWAPSLAALFAEAVTALGEICYDRERVAPAEQRTLQVAGDSHEERLVHWLQEVYFWLERDLWLTAYVEPVEVTGEVVRGLFRGERYDPLRHTIHTEIKAITYHQLRVRAEGGLWRTTVIVDV
ncbi:MAG TPA: archease [Thermoanaerobaculia bacterium]|nr:archease [Thermoanaerobaculia bacterium]